MSPACIKHYEALGWTFKHEEWRNHHNGDPEDDWNVKSPRLTKPFDAYKPFDELREASMLAQEKVAYVSQRMTRWRDSWRGDHPIKRALFKDPEAKRITVTLTIP